MLYGRTVISKKLEDTIKNEIAELRDEGKMSLDMFYRNPYMLGFLGLQDTYSEMDLENAILAELEGLLWKWVRILRLWQDKSILFWMGKISIWICFFTINPCADWFL